jgi:hypothetical protein
VNERRNDPNVEGAYADGNTVGSAPWRNTLRSSMLSAPAAIPATREAIFNPAFAPVCVGTLRCCWANSTRPVACAKPISGTRPAEPIRLGSSNTADDTWRM